MNMGKISAVYKIVNTVTGEFYIGSSVDVMRRWSKHRRPSTWKEHPNLPLYQDMQKYGLDKFQFQILAPVMPEYLKQVEQEFIELLNPKYNNCRAFGRNTERYREYRNRYYKSELGKAHNKKYMQSEKGIAAHNKASRKYDNQPCEYNGEILTLHRLSGRFYRAGIPHPNIEAKKYLITPNP